MHDHHQVGGAFVDRHADIAHVERQTRLSDADAVLNLDLRDIQIGADVETLQAIEDFGGWFSFEFCTTC